MAADTPAVAAPAVAEPAVVLTLREGSTAVFADSEVDLHVGLQPAGTTGKLVWRHTVENRTLSSGEIALDPNERVALKLWVPALNEGVAIRTELTLSLVGDIAKPRKQDPLATFTRVLWIVDPDAFAGRKKWLEALKLALYDPVGETAPVFEKSKIPFTKIATLAAVDQLTEGILVIGEGVDLTKAPGLNDSMFQLVRREIPVICLAPQNGELPYPAAEGSGAVAVRFDGDGIVKELDKRLSAAAWSCDGATTVQRFVPTTIRGEIGLRLSGQASGWPWIEAVYPRKTKLILCGYPLIATWQREPAARYLLARILESLDRSKETASD